MKKTAKKKLVLAKETVRSLDLKLERAVVGGFSIYCQTNPSGPEYYCPNEPATRTCAG